MLRCREWVHAHHQYPCADDASVLVADVRREHSEHMLRVYPSDTSVEWLGDWYESHDSPPGSQPMHT